MLQEPTSIYAIGARKIAARVLKALASRGQRAVAESIGKHESFVSRWKTEDLETCAEILATLHLKVVPTTAQCYDAEHLQHILYFAKIGMQNPEPKLVEDWDE